MAEASAVIVLCLNGVQQGYLKASEPWISSMSVSPLRLWPGRLGVEPEMHGWLDTQAAGAVQA